MNIEALEHSFNLFKKDGYNKQLEDYKELIKEDEKALDHAHVLFVEDGYNKPLEEFKKLIIETDPDPEKEGKTEVVAEKAAAVTTPNATAAMDLELEDISLEQYDAMTPAEKKKIKNYKLKQRLIRESAAKRNIKDKGETIVEIQKDAIIPDTLTDEGARENYYKRTGRYPSTIMDVTEEDYKAKIFDKPKTSLNKELFVENIEKIQNLEKQKQELQEKNQDIQFVDDQINTIKSNPIFDLQLKALNELKADNSNYSNTGFILEDAENMAINALKLVGVDIEKPIETIDIPNDVAAEALDGMSKRNLQKLSSGNVTLQEKENIINNAQAEVYKIKTEINDVSLSNVEKKYQQDVGNMVIQAEDIASNIELLNEMFKDPLNKTKENVNKYNSLVQDYKNIELKIKNSKDFYNKEYENLIVERDKIASNQNLQIVGDVLVPIKDNFEATKRVKEYSEGFNKEGWWNGAADVVNTFAQGMFQTAGKAYAGGATWLLTGLGDIFTDQENYSVFDAFSDSMTNALNYDFLQVSKDEKFDIINEEGKLKPLKEVPRNYLKTAAEMLPFSIQIMNDVKRGKFTGYKKALGNSISNFKNKTSILSPVSQKLKNNIIMADTAFNVTVLDNKAQAQKQGLNDFQSTTYAGTVSLFEGLVQSVMPDANFFKGIKGSKLLETYKNNLRFAANKQAIKKATQQFTKSVALEIGEEELQAGSEIFTQLSYGLGLPDAATFVEDQQRLIAGTLMLSGGLGTVGASKTLQSEKVNFYKQMSANSESLLMELTAMANDIKDPELKQEFRDAQLYAADIIEAVNNSPESVTSEQVDLLVEKKRLLKKKESAPEVFKSDINEEIKAVNEKIKESKISKVQEARTEEREKQLGKLAEKLNVQSIIGTQKEIDKQVEELQKQGVNVSKEDTKQYGTFFTKPDGTIGVIVNKDLEKEGAIRTTQLHEMAHVILYDTFKKNPQSAINASNELLKELQKATFTSSEFENRFNEYQSLVEKGEIKEAEAMEEAITLAIEGVESGGIVLEENNITKIQDFWRRLLRSFGIENLKFDKGADVINFIKDYNRFARTGKGISALEKVAKKGIKGKLIESEVLKQDEEDIKKYTSSPKGTKASE